MIPVYRPSGIRYGGDVNLIQALLCNVGPVVPMAREKSKSRTHEDESTDAGHGGGLPRRSYKVSVKEKERRG